MKWGPTLKCIFVAKKSSVVFVWSCDWQFWAVFLLRHFSFVLILGYKTRLQRMDAIKFTAFLWPSLFVLRAEYLTFSRQFIGVHFREKLPREVGLKNVKFLCGNAWYGFCLIGQQSWCTWCTYAALINVRVALNCLRSSFFHHPFKYNLFSVDHRQTFVATCPKIFPC